MVLKNKFIRNNILLSLFLFTLFIIDFCIIISKVDDLDIAYIYIQILYGIIVISAIQFIVCLLYSLLKIKSINIKTIISLILLLIIPLFEFRFLFSALAGFLGDM